MEYTKEQVIEIIENLFDVIDKQEARIKDYEDSYKAVMAERCTDEVHCTCVPALKVRLKELLQAQKIEQG